MTTVQRTLWQSAQLLKLRREEEPASESTCGSSGVSTTSEHDETEVVPSVSVPCFVERNCVPTEYPEELTVRNTFLDIASLRSESLDGFLQPRQVQSAPGSFAEDIARRAPGPIEDTGIKTSTASTAVQRQAAPQHHHNTLENQSQNALQLAVLVPEPELGSPELPTVGSAKHKHGQCKPCAFIWKEPGCGNGINCPFCHLCEDGEKKRRAKEKKTRIRAMRNKAATMQQAAIAGFNRLVS